MAIRKRRIQANYLKVGETFELLGTGFTELNESPSAQTSSKRYINQASASQSVTGYEWSTSFNTDQIVSDKAIEYIRNIGEMQKTGADTETEYIIVDLDKEAKASGFRARKFKIAIAVDSFDDNDGELGISGTFLAQSDPILGTFNTTEKTFAEGFEAKTV
ncbi:phage tail tube protein [Clostridium cadaveris]